IYDQSHVEQIHFVYLDDRPNFQWNRFIVLDTDIFVSLLRNNHVLGSVSYNVSWGKQTEKKQSVLFSGDVGNSTETNSAPSLLRHMQHPHKNTGFIVTESTYGNRNRPKDPNFQERITLLEKEVIDCIFNKKGTLLIPAFSFHRTQELLFDLYYLLKYRWAGSNKFQGQPITVYHDSPLANKISGIYAKELASGKLIGKKFKTPNLNKEMGDILEVNDNQLQEIFKDIYTHRPLNIGGHQIQSLSPGETPTKPCIILSSSGMCDNGPVINHLLDLLNSPTNTVLMTGYLGKGSIGAQLMELSSLSEVEKDHTNIKFTEKHIKMPANEIFADIKMISGYSGHADQSGLVNYIFPEGGEPYTSMPTIFINHGNYEAKISLKTELENRSHDFEMISHGELNVIIPEIENEWFDLSSGKWSQNQPKNLTDKDSEYEKIIQNLTYQVSNLSEEVQRLSR
ncbi:MAG: MBL fold metallo-hydrolase, partial [SAR324 cluster bacterium]|nr:MBL fold metallo-hydrolase [SAR324 cluster bacterium]